jgi:diaminopimelate decarboxylase
VANAGYVLTNDTLTTVTLPTTASPGDLVRVLGTGAGGW